MDKLIFQGEGWPLTQEALQFMQNSQDSLINALTRAYGNQCVIFDSVYGEVGGFAPSGWIIWNNEMIPFLGGTVSEFVVIVEETTEAGYDTNNTGDFTNVQPVWKKRYAKFGALGSGVTSLNYESLQKYESNNMLMTKTRFLKKGKIRVFQNSSLPNVFPISGNFTSAEEITEGYEANGYKYFKINFAPISNGGDYFPIIHRKSNDFGLNTSRGILIGERASDYFVVGLKPQADDQSPLDAIMVETLEIYLLG